MSEGSFHESVVAADRWSKVLALVVAIGVFLAVRELVGDVQFSSIVAATAGIGARLYVPYHASVRVPEPERRPLSEHPTAGNYHHGAAGLALIATSVVAVGVFEFGHGVVTAVGVGVICGSGAYLLCASALPTA
ncbi:hypothetical protein [Halorubrum cibi]|uniref:Uncharacterized protein n=1 Tax=Halorubrum cibi TaxID=413815 RepID=A0A521BYF9_9EURY|nr:hypothetical protein [Halorubrum cibi]SMO52217.1 hypothetical protein SAMN06264867_103184 [Halorubrum cibi]